MKYIVISICIAILTIFTIPLSAEEVYEGTYHQVFDDYVITYYVDSQSVVVYSDALPILRGGQEFGIAYIRILAEDGLVQLITLSVSEISMEPFVFTYDYYYQTLNDAPRVRLLEEDPDDA